MKSNYLNFEEEEKYIDDEMKDFIESNYSEVYQHAKELLIESIIKYPFTISEINDGLRILIKAYDCKVSLGRQLYFIGKLTQHGVSASIAGGKLRDVLLDSHKYIK